MIPMLSFPSPTLLGLTLHHIPLNILPDCSYRNKSVSLLLNWQNDGDTSKSDSSINRLVNEVLLHPDFKLSDLKGFSTWWDKADSKSTLLTSFSEASIDIEVPSGDKNIPPAKFSVTGPLYHPLLSILCSAFADPLATKFHLSPYKMFHKSPTSSVEQRTGKGRRCYDVLVRFDAPSKLRDGQVMANLYDDGKSVKIHLCTA